MNRFRCWLIGVWCAMVDHDRRVGIEHGVLVVRCTRCGDVSQVFAERAR